MALACLTVLHFHSCFWDGLCTQVTNGDDNSVGVLDDRSNQFLLTAFRLGARSTAEVGGDKCVDGRLCFFGVTKICFLHAVDEKKQQPSSPLIWVTELLLYDRIRVPCRMRHPPESTDFLPAFSLPCAATLKRVDLLWRNFGILDTSTCTRVVT